MFWIILVMGAFVHLSLVTGGSELSRVDTFGRVFAGVFCGVILGFPLAALVTGVFGRFFHQKEKMRNVFIKDVTIELKGSSPSGFMNSGLTHDMWHVSYTVNGKRHTDILRQEQLTVVKSHVGTSWWREVYNVYPWYLAPFLLSDGVTRRVLFT